jgi:hypothetical protein
LDDAANTDFASLSALNAAWPVGAYSFTIRAVNDGTKTVPLNLPSSNFPNAPRLTSLAPGAAFDATQPLVLKWEAFTGGTVNDYVFVQVWDSITDEDVFMSPLPGLSGALSGTATQLTLPANTLQTGRAYELSLMFCKVVGKNTTAYPGVTALAFYVSDTSFALGGASRVPDASLAYVFKSAKYDQTGATTVQTAAEKPFRFDAAVIGTSSTSLSAARVSVPGGGTVALIRDGPALDLKNAPNTAFASSSALNVAWPSGTYNLTIEGVNDGTKTVPLNLPSSDFPNAPRLTNLAPGAAFDATQPLVLQWEAFAGGTANDFIVVEVRDDSTDQDVFMSPLPGSPGALSGTATQLTLPANTLQTGRGYELSLIFAKVVGSNTTAYPGVAALAFHISETSFALGPKGTGGSLQVRFWAHGQFNPAAAGLVAATLPQNPSYDLRFRIADQAYPPKEQVIFHWPAGSGYGPRPAEWFGVSGDQGHYNGPLLGVPSYPPNGNYAVTYKGDTTPFTVDASQCANHHLLLMPTIHLNAQSLIQGISWTYRNLSGQPMPAPDFADSFKVQVDGPNGRVFDSPSTLDTNALSAALAAANLSWNNVSRVRLILRDQQGFLFFSSYDNPALQPADVDSVLLFKWQWYEQTAAGLALVPGTPYWFWADYRLAAGGGVSSATLTVPKTPPTVESFPVGSGAILHEYTTAAAVDLAYPFGTYTFNLQTAHGGTLAIPVDFPATAFPAAVQVVNFQEAQAVNPNTTFTLRWNAPPAGTTLSVEVFDDSGRVFGGPADGTAIDISAGTLRPNRTYRVSLDLQLQPVAGQYAGVNLSSQLLTTTSFDLKTIGGQTALVLTQQNSGTQAKLNSAVFGKNLFVVVGDGGTILTSPDATAWTKQNSPSTVNLYGVAFGGDRFVAVGAGGAILGSPNAVAWSQVSSPTSRRLSAVAYGNGQFVAVGDGGTLLTSAGGSSWTSAASPVTSDLFSVAYGNGRFVAVGNAGSVVTGPPWVPGMSGTALSLRGVTYGPGMFFAVGNNGVGLLSALGVTWQTFNAGVTDGMYQIAFGDGTGIAVAGGAAGGVMVWSTDGTNFARQLSQTADLYGITFGNHVFVAVGWDGTIVTTRSPNQPFNAYLTWAVAQGLNPANGVPEADPDGDGVVNFGEFAFGENPLQPSRAAVPRAAVVDGYLAITYQQWPNGNGTVGVDYTANGIRYTVEVSADLSPGSWLAGADIVEFLPATRVLNPNGTETVTVRLKAPIRFGPMRFARLRLTWVE